MKKFTLLVSLALVLGLVIGCPNDTPAPSGDYTLTVIDGSGSGSYKVGTKVEISATTPEGNTFIKWSANCKDVVFEDATASKTSFSMLAQDIIVRANDDRLTMVKATLSGSEVTLAESSDADATTFKAALNAVVDDSNRETITQITIVPPAGGAKILPEADLSRLFSDGDSNANWAPYRALSTINGLEHLDTSRVTNMSYMFSFCSSLATIDVSNFITSAVTDMGSMFSDCSSLTTLDISNFVTSAVTDMGYMFSDCSSLTTLDISNFVTSKVTNVGFMFYPVTLTNVTVGNLLTENIAKRIEPKHGDVDNGGTASYANPGMWLREGSAYEGPTIEMSNGKAVAGTYTAKLAE